MNQDSNQPSKKHNTRPVVTYILILFTAAFLLLTFSLLANQRNNDQTLDELRASIASIEEGQSTQDHVMSLQEENALYEQELLILQEELEDAQDLADTSEQTAQALSESLYAMKLLFILEENYRSGDLDACYASITYMEDTSSDQALYAMDDPAYGQRYDALVALILEQAD